MVNGDLDLAKPCYLIELYDRSGKDLKYKICNVNKPDSQTGFELIELNIDRRLNSSANSAEIKIFNSSMNSVEPEIRDKVKIWLGYNNLASKGDPFYSIVFTGNIIEFKNGFEITSIYCASDCIKIARKNIDRSFSKIMNLDDIVKKMVADYGGVPIAKNGIGKTRICKQKGFAISDQLSIYDNLMKLIELNGFDMYMDVNDEFNARPWDPDELKTVRSDNESSPRLLTWISDLGKDENRVDNRMLFEFEHGVNVIEIQLELSDRNQKAVEIIDPQSISPNHTNYTIMPTHINSTLIPGMAEVPDLQSLRSDQPKDRKIITKISKRDLIDVFTNLSRRRKNRYHGNIKHIGSPQVRLTDGAKVIGLNMDDKVFKIIRVEHIFNMTDGFVTRIGVEEYITSKK